jgi:hypothetical protein
MYISAVRCRAPQAWLARACVRTLSIQKASPGESGYVESFNGRLKFPTSLMNPGTNAGGAGWVVDQLVDWWPVVGWVVVALDIRCAGSPERLRGRPSPR